MIGDGTDPFGVSNAAATEFLDDEGHEKDTLPARFGALGPINASGA